MALASVASALSLGEIQVRSPMGQPFDAQVSVADIAEGGQLKASLANVNDYKQLGLQYPYGQRFHFRLLEESGKSPTIQISTTQPVNDPFIYLLVEVSSDSGTLLKTYAILLDPPASLIAHDVPVVLPAELPQPESVAEHLAGKVAQPAEKPMQHSRHVKKHHVSPATRAHSNPKLTAQEGVSRVKPAMTLSISKYDPATSPASNNDALQEELIANVKQIEELKLQISELKAVIKDLQSKPGSTSQDIDNKYYSGKAESAAAGGEMAGHIPSQEVPRPDLLPVRAPAVEAGKSTAVNWFGPLLAITVLILLSIWYLKYRPFQTSKTGDDDVLPEAPMETTMKVPAYGSRNHSSRVSQPDISPMARPLEVSPLTLIAAVEARNTVDNECEKAELSFCEPSMEASAYSPAWMPVPAEYALLMAADSFLRAGDEKSAEGALQQAIQENPQNIYGYIALLKLYGQRNDIVRFAECAEKFKALADEASFADVAEQGRKLDPGNPLYA
ncbi:MAG: hypothetical protein PHH47_12735 [Gallionella sp.]|nr:hypothetical protein [Gallionella sp.]MDD4946594.1 hypothetical protein [Gallionella sp.]MDD5612112.1 hypothetical protein [Gallionella sp.]